MARFQAQVNSALEGDLNDLRQSLGLSPNQKADLLGEMVRLSAWIVHFAQKGWSVQARKGRSVEHLHSIVLDRTRRKKGATGLRRVTLNAEEADRLLDLLEGGFAPTPALRNSLKHISGTERKPPSLKWPPADE